jgi:hypothetical protein
MSGCSWTSVARGAVLLGLGLGCDRPKPVKRCPFHVGVVLAKPYQDFSDDPSQRYVDSLQNKEMAKDHIHWVIPKGDVIDPRTGIVKTVPITRRITSDGSKAGEIKVVTSWRDRPRDLPTRLQGPGNGL